MALKFREVPFFENILMKGIFGDFIWEKLLQLRSWVDTDVITYKEDEELGRYL